MTEITAFDIDFLMKMRHSPRRNYIVPGLTSWLIGEPSAHGCVRLFECEREQMVFVIPHSHRFDFTCFVLKGSVINHIFKPAGFSDGDLYSRSIQKYGGVVGGYSTEVAGQGRYAIDSKQYQKGARYSMRHDEIHSIVFGRKSLVLFFEGPTKVDHSVILEPEVDVGSGLTERIPLFEVKEWMFKKEPAQRQES